MRRIYGQSEVAMAKSRFARTMSFAISLISLRPRGMSSELRERIATDLRAVAAADTLIATRLEATGQIVDIRGPAEFAAGVEEQRAKLAAIAKTLGIKPAQ